MGLIHHFSKRICKKKNINFLGTYFLCTYFTIIRKKSVRLSVRLLVLYKYCLALFVDSLYIWNLQVTLFSYPLLYIARRGVWMRIQQVKVLKILTLLEKVKAYSCTCSILMTACSFDVKLATEKMYFLTWHGASVISIC